MKLSVIIPTRNRGRHLRRIIDSLAVQTVPQDAFEVIVVDNGSEDETRAVVSSFKERIRNLRYVREEIPGLHAARHRGMRESRTDILAYCDDDIVAAPTWLEGIRESFQDDSVVLAGGNSIPRYESPPPPWIDTLWEHTPWGRILGFFSLVDFDCEAGDIPPQYVWGCNFSIRKDVLFEVEGFHPDSMPSELITYRGDGETWVTSSIARRGYRAVFNPKASVCHCIPDERMTLAFLYRRSYLQGISDSYTHIRARGGISFLHRTESLIRYLATHAGTCVMHRGRPSLYIRTGYRDGYLHHQREVSRDDELLDWVLQSHYISPHTS